MIKRRPSTTHIVVHCTATREGEDNHVDAYTIDRMHKERGFRRSVQGVRHQHIGYHEVIPRDGSVQLGRYHDEKGAGHRYHNDYTYHICMTGGLDEFGKYSGKYNEKQFNMLEKRIDAALEIWPDAEVCGHRDLPDANKACPCFDAGEWYRKRKESANWGPVKPMFTFPWEFDQAFYNWRAKDE